MLIAGHIITAAPASEFKIHQCAQWAIADSDGTSVAQPDVAKRKSLNGHAGVNQHACGIRRGSVCRYQPHFLSFAVRMHGIGEGGGLHPRALKCVWPFGGIAWKADPCPIMLGPFGWLAVGRSEEHTSELQSLMR